MPRPISRNLWKIYLDRFFSCFWLIGPVLIPFFQSHGLNATEILLIEGSYSLALVFFEVPTGYLSDVVGRRATLLMGSILLPAGVAVYALSDSVVGFLVAEVLVAMGNSLRSGTDSALLYDTLSELKREGEYKRLEGHGVFLERTGSAVAAVLGGLLALVTVRLPFYCNALAFLSLFPLALAMLEPTRALAQRTTSHMAEILRVVKYCFQHAQIRMLMFYAALVTSTGIAGIWTYYFLFRELNISVGYYGILAAVMSFANGIGGKQAHLIEQWVGPRRVLAIPLLMAPAFFLLGHIHALWALPLIYVNAFVWGTSEPLLRDYINKLTGAEIRATVLSVVSMAGRLAFFVLAFVVGRITDIFSLQAAMYFLASVVLAFGTLLLLSLRQEQR